MNPITASSHSSLSGTAVKTGEDTSTALRGLDLERLVKLSAPAMEDLYRQLDSPTTTVLLADSQGGVLRAIGNGHEAGGSNSANANANTGDAGSACLRGRSRCTRH